MKLLIIGSVANGKTTLAKKLEKKYNIKMYEIDSIVHNDKYNVKRTVEEHKQLLLK